MNQTFQKERTMENYMNAPIQLEWTDKDVLEDFEKYMIRKQFPEDFAFPCLK